MAHHHPSRWGALVLGLALALPLAAGAAATAAQPLQLAQAPSPKDPATAPAPPTTAPVKGADVKHDAPPQIAAPQAAQGSTAVPGWNNPPADWNAVSERPQYASIPGPETNRLIQEEGRKWRAFRNGTLTQTGGWVIVLVLAALVLFYLVKGPIKLHGAPTGRLIERFNAVERAAHWTMAISFVALALTGIIMFFGKYLILPWLGYAGFSWVTIVSKNLHNFVGPLFIFSIVVGFLIFVKDNLIGSEDFKWLTHIGSVFSGKEYPSGRFNGLEKVWFWGGLVVLGIAMAVTGLILDFPNWNQARGAMQTSEMIHVIAAVLFIAAAMGHIYIGTVGMEGAYRAMRDGYVDEEWAREHHAYWYEEVKQGKRPERIVGGQPQPAPGDD